MQYILETAFKVSSENFFGRLKMPGPSKKKPISEAAFWPSDLMRTSIPAIEAHDRLAVLQKKLNAEGSKRMTAKNP
jgi:hypothetical protein